MAKKTVILIVSLLVISVILFAVAITAGSTSPTDKIAASKKIAIPSPTPEDQVRLALSPETIYIGQTRVGSSDIILDTDAHEVNEVQIELSYNPAILTNVQIRPASFFQNPLIVINTRDDRSGRISYSLKASAAQKSVKGIGTVATITFTQLAVAPGIIQTPLILLPKSRVASENINESLLKEPLGATVMLYQTNTIQASPSAR